MLVKLGYKPSVVTGGKTIYLTRQPNLARFFTEIKPANEKRRQRYYTLRSVGTQAVNEDAL